MTTTTAGLAITSFVNYERRLQRLALILLRNSADAEDVFQNCAIKMLKVGLIGFENDRLESAFFSMVVRNECLSLIRKRRRSKEVLEAEFDSDHRLEDAIPRTDPAEPDLEDFLSWLLSQVRKEDKELLQARFTDGATYRQLAEMLGVSKRQAISRVHRLLERLRAIADVA